MKELRLEVKKLERRETKTKICDWFATCFGEWCGTCIGAMMESAGCAS